MSGREGKRSDAAAGVGLPAVLPDAGVGVERPAALPDPAALACPLPRDDYRTVVLAHGGGGRLSRALVEEVFLPAYGDAGPAELHDGAVLQLPGTRLALSTDSFVVDPPFFPGGDIGELAVNGTVNDLAMCGARPLALTAGFILEEGFPMEDLRRVARSMDRAARAAGVSIVTGDTKVVERGKGDGIFINTTGVGVVEGGVEIAPRRAAVGDAILVSGVIGSHGIAIMSVREGIGFDTTLVSDTAPLWEPVQRLLATAGAAVHVLRDPTRGGVASALNEIAASAGVGVLLEEAAIPVADEVRGACELLGLDPLYVANEGKLLAFVAPQCAEEALAALRAHPLGRDAAIIGRVVAEHPGRVHLRSRIGGLRVVDMLSGEQLPRIC